MISLDEKNHFSLLHPYIVASFILSGTQPMNDLEKFRMLLKQVIFSYLSYSKYIDCYFSSIWCVQQNWKRTNVGPIPVDIHTVDHEWILYFFQFNFPSVGKYSNHWVVRQFILVGKNELSIHHTCVQMRTINRVRVISWCLERDI